MTAPSYGDPAVAAFVVIPLALVCALAWGLAAASRRLGQGAGGRRALIAVLAAIAWMAATWNAAASGVLRQWDATPPPLAFLVLAIVLAGALLAFSSYGTVLVRGLPLWVLVGVQGFRLPLELAMHAMAERGVMPAVMSYSGRNFDILTGITALLVAAALRFGVAPPWLTQAWNAFGLVLLLNIVTVALAATPRFAYFGPENLNVWVTYPPFVWLPAVMVTAALAGHLLIFRALRAAPVAGAPSAAAASRR